MSTLTLNQYMGKLGQMFVNASPIRINVTIQDVKLAYGNVRYLVTPISGTGQVWVDSSRVKISEEKGDGQ